MLVFDKQFNAISADMHTAKQDSHRQQLYKFVIDTQKRLREWWWYGKDEEWEKEESWKTRGQFFRILTAFVVCLTRGETKLDPQYHHNCKLFRALTFKFIREPASRVFESFSAQTCALPHDKVFGLLGLMPKATAVSPETFFADYTQSPLELFQKVVLHFSRHERVDEPKRINESSMEMRRLRDEENL
jgi:hypothetical protein